MQENVQDRAGLVSREVHKCQCLLSELKTELDVKAFLLLS